MTRSTDQPLGDPQLMLARRPPVEHYEGLSELLMQKLSRKPFLRLSAETAPTSSTVRQQRGGPLTEPSIVQVEAAKLRLVTDRRLGKESPSWLQPVAIPASAI